MKKNKKQKTVQETLSSIDAVLAALNSYPNLEDALLEKAQGELNKYLGQLFPTQLDFAKDILEHLVGTDVLIEIVSKFLTVALPGVEVGLKSALLAKMQNLGTNCTIDPFIYEKAIKEGILFDLRQIDLYDKLTVSPLDKKIGKYYYFGIDDCESSHDVLMSAIDPNNQTEKRKISDSVGHYFGARKRDFDCLLWYMKNKGVTRQVWGKRTSANESIFNGDGNIEGWVENKGKKNTTYYNISGESITQYTKGEDGKVTGRPGGKMEVMDTSNKYVYKLKNTYYEYSYGKPNISKLSRKKIYYNEISDGVYKMCLFENGAGGSGGSWVAKGPQSLENYESVEDIPKDKDIPSGSFIVIDGSLYFLKDGITFKTKRHEVKDRDTGVSKPVDEKYISSFKKEECINLTTSLTSDTALYIDYDEMQGTTKKGEMVKDGENPPSSTFVDCGFVDKNYGQKQWSKKKIKKEEYEKGNKVEQKNCYYIDKDNDKKYKSGIDKIMIPPHDDKGFFVNINKKKAKNNKYTKDFGVVTLEYSPRTGNVLQSDGKPMKQQTPYDNVLHVFFGNVKELSQDYNAAVEDWNSSSDVNKDAQKLYRQMQKWHNTHLKSWKEKQRQWKKQNINELDKYQYNLVFEDGYLFYLSLFGGGKYKEINFEKNLPAGYGFGEGELDKLSEIIENFTEKANSYEKKVYSLLNRGKDSDKDNFKVVDKNSNRSEFNELQFNSFTGEIINYLQLNDGGPHYTLTAITERIAQVMDTRESMTYLKARNVTYPEADKNYYLKRTLFEFNADYINSLQLFDPKVLAAQLITSLFGGITISAMIGATASWKTELIRDVVKDMVQKQIAAEDFAVSDCFFTFTNDAYNGMLRAADMRQAGLYSQHGEENGNSTIDPIKLLEGLNDIDNCADQAGQTEVIKGAIMNASGEVCKDEYKENNYLAVNTNFGLQMSFIDTLMINLCTQLVMAILSPKVYLLILINLEMFGLSTNFDIKAFLERFEALIRSIVKSIVDQFMQYITQEIMKIIEEVLQKLIVKLSFEQVEMYARLIKQILMHLRMLTSCGGGLGWTQDSVEYADIVSSESSQEPIDEC